MFFDYDKMLQEKFKSLVSDILKHIEKEGLPSGHHFYITFATSHPQLILPDYLIDENPEEMTIVLQHQFWDFEVDAKGFGMLLNFDGSNHNVYIPFDSLIAIVDPYADFGLEFEPTFEVTLDDELPKKDTAKADGNVVSIDFSKRK